MDLLDSILNAKGGEIVSQLAGQFGLQQDQAVSAIQNLMPALAGGLQRNISQGGLDNLMSALMNGQHQRYLDEPSHLNLETVREDGNGILGHILGSKDASRLVATQASERTGISESVLKQMLPAVAAMAMGALSKSTTQARAAHAGVASVTSDAAPTGADIIGMLTPLIDRNRDGSVVDDIVGSASRFLKNVI